MSMRTWARKVAHAKAESYEVKKVNKPRMFNGKKQPSLFASRWRVMANLPVNKNSRKERKAHV